MSKSKSSRTHWEAIYKVKPASEVSWHQDRPCLSTELVHRANLNPNAVVLDIGGGSSTLVDTPLAEGHRSLIVLDISAIALAHAQRRLGERAKQIRWIVADITTWTPDFTVDFWHDRAILHFLTERADQEAYVRSLKSAVRPNGWVAIAGFALGGPETCSGLQIVRHDASSLQELLSDDFVLVEERNEMHRTPAGVGQAFRDHLFRRKRF